MQDAGGACAHLRDTRGLTDEVLKALPDKALRRVLQKLEFADLAGVLRSAPSYGLDTGSGAAALDQSGNGNNGTLSYLVDGVSGSKTITRQLF